MSSFYFIFYNHNMLQVFDLSTDPKNHETQYILPPVDQSSRPKEEQDIIKTPKFKLY